DRRGDGLAGVRHEVHALMAARAAVAPGAELALAVGVVTARFVARRVGEVGPAVAVDVLALPDEFQRRALGPRRRRDAGDRLLDGAGHLGARVRRIERAGGGGCGGDDAGQGEQQEGPVFGQIAETRADARYHSEPLLKDAPSPDRVAGFEAD